MLKDKIENDNYAELCEKAYKFITNGIALPPQEKDQFAEVMKNLTSGLSQVIQNGGNISDALPSMPIKGSKEEELKELADKNLLKSVAYNDVVCYICGYSVEFDCLIAGTFDDRVRCKTISDNDCLLRSHYPYYLYVPKDIVKE
jgi:hypothetical protein